VHRTLLTWPMKQFLLFKMSAWSLRLVLTTYKEI